METLEYRVSKVTGQQLNATEYTYYIKFPAKQDYSYTIRATEEGFWMMCELWRKLGLEVKKMPLEG